jgi:hypothetical protein
LTGFDQGLTVHAKGGQGRREGQFLPFSPLLAYGRIGAKKYFSKWLNLAEFG